MTRKASLFLAATVLTAGLASPSMAAVLFSTGFSSPTYTNGVLNVGADTTTPGQDGWLNTSGGGTNNITVSGLPANGLVSMTTSGQDVRRLFDGGATVTSGSIWFSADISVSAAQATGDYALHMGDGSTTIFNARTYIKSSGAGYVMALGTGTGTAVTYGTTELPFNQLQHILVRYDLVAGAANDTGALFVNPSTPDGSGDTAYVNATTIGTDASSFASFSLRQGSATAAATLTVDNISVFTAGGGVVPEPASLGLLAIAGGAMIRRRR